MTVIVNYPTLKDGASSFNGEMLIHKCRSLIAPRLAVPLIPNGNVDYRVNTSTINTKLVYAKNI
jgi:hypothetical protein